MAHFEWASNAEGVSRFHHPAARCEAERNRVSLVVSLVADKFETLVYFSANNRGPIGMHPFTVDKLDRDMGVCLMAMCPHCYQATQFRLRERSAALHVFGFALLHFGQAYELLCSSCGFRKEIVDHEL